MGPELLAVVPAYLLGTFPTAQVVGRRAGHDPTAEGSGNPGASNVYRIAGRRAGITVFAGDLAKGLVATAAGHALGGRDLAFATGAAAVAGHMFPVMRSFRGGKGVATAAGLSIVLFPAVSGALAGVWVAMAKGARKPSVASLAAAVGLPVGVAATGRPLRETAAAAALSAVVVARHRSNIRRLLRNEEEPLPVGDAAR